MGAGLGQDVEFREKWGKGRNRGSATFGESRQSLLGEVGGL